MIRSVAVCIPTRDRPAQLAKALDGVAGQEDSGLEVTVVVADNSTKQSARQMCSAHDLSPIYVSELRPGVSHVRNTLIEVVDDLGVDVVYFVDDDMVPQPGCLRAFRDAAELWPDTIFTGPVDYAWEVVDGTPVSSAPIPINREERAHGALLRVTGTGNSFIPMAIWRRFGKPQFDSALGLSGGEDTDFFYRLTEGGAQLRWCAGARAVESLPSHLGSPSAVAGRFLRAGYANGAIALRHRPRWVVLSQGVARCVAGAAAMSVPARLSPLSNPRATLYGGLGRVRAALGRPPRHYGLEG